VLVATVLTRPRPAVPAGEAPATLLEPPPRALGLADQLALWGNLGITLTLPVAAAFVLNPFGLPPLSLVAALTAVAVGSVLGSLLLGLAALAGARTGAPAMVLLRGLFGRRGSYLPTALNLLQCLGWTVVEVVIIAEAAAALTSEDLRPLYVVLAGVGATLLALRPLGAVRTLRRYALWVVLAATAYLFVQVLREPLPGFGDGSWTGFWRAVDVVVALPVSWIPLAADYSRHSRTGRAAFAGAAGGFAAACTLYFALGVFAVAALSPVEGDVIGALLALPAGAVALAVLVLDELDEAFANLYSSVVSTQNVRPGVDRRLLAVGVGVLATVLAFWADVADYESFLFLIGSVFIPLSAVVVVDYFVLGRGRGWDVGPAARPRWLMAVPWAAGFLAYQLVNPGLVSWWAGFWTDRQADLGFVPPNWLSASVLSAVVAAALTLVVGRLAPRGRRLRD
jgi:NCS1 family nucleobase:cation symporter-1